MTIRICTCILIIGERERANLKSSEWRDFCTAFSVRRFLSDPVYIIMKALKCKTLGASVMYIVYS